LGGEVDLVFSLIVPCHNEEENIEPIYSAARAALENMHINNYELIFIDDGSSDSTLAKVKSLCHADKNVRYISLSRNFGKESAMLAGFEHAFGDYVAVLDSDMQDPPELLVEMYNILTTEDFDFVGTRRVSRVGEPRIRSFFARQFYKIIRGLSAMDIVDGCRDFRLMKRCVVDAILSLKERDRFSKGLFTWVGFKGKYLEYTNVARTRGKTKWSFWKLFIYSLEGILSFSAAPLALSSLLGLIACAVAFLLILFFILQKLIYGIDVPGYAAMICIILFLGGVQLLSVGIVGQYLARVFKEVKGRPNYIVRESSVDLVRKWKDTSFEK